MVVDFHLLIIIVYLLHLLEGLPLGVSLLRGLLHVLSLTILAEEHVGHQFLLGSCQNACHDVGVAVFLIESLQVRELVDILFLITGIIQGVIDVMFHLFLLEQGDTLQWFLVL
jgi:hypothetical protein